MGFDHCNHFLKIWKSIWTPIPKVGVHLGMWGFIPSHSPTLLRTWNVTPSLHTWPALSQALTLVMSPRLRLWHFYYYADSWNYWQFPFVNVFTASTFVNTMNNVSPIVVFTNGKNAFVHVTNIGGFAIDF